MRNVSDKPTSQRVAYRPVAIRIVMTSLVMYVVAIISDHVFDKTTAAECCSYSEVCAAVYVVIYTERCGDPALYECRGRG